MVRKQIPVTMEAIEDLLDRKLDEKLEQKFEEKLKPIKDEIAQIKDVVENRIYKELRETRREMKDGFARVDEITAAVMVDVNGHDDRIKRLEKNTGISNN